MRHRAHRGGQVLVDYAIVLAGVALVALIALTIFGDAVSAGLDLIWRVIDGAGRRRALG